MKDRFPCDDVQKGEEDGQWNPWVKINETSWLNFDVWRQEQEWREKAERQLFKEIFEAGGFLPWVINKDRDKPDEYFKPRTDL